MRGLIGVDRGVPSPCPHLVLDRQVAHLGWSGAATDPACTMGSMLTGRAGGAKLVIFIVLVLASGGMLVGTTNALGQAAIQQYIPSADPADRHESGSSASPTAAGEILGPGGGGIREVASTDDSGSASGGSLPLANYPSTPFVTIIAVILAIGLVVRVVAPAVARRWPHAGPPEA
jgi:hypothetical protein